MKRRTRPTSTAPRISAISLAAAWSDGSAPELPLTSSANAGAGDPLVSRNERLIRQLEIAAILIDLA
ncbi:hypothetical protein SPF06_03835 [Sinomonas sp. JGH33]|uniref:Uncharacterized protein n=1 Tax=Sinomonas terricola TaxID=3110330 RepID=A0ABU5T2G1_9MICC|nr:hypothetical protein [Sinomonas sp. JGH33]MEA5453844.1 hypothetical protein [Sinomonas sp. JGH33]